jgi:hypothetical protein
MLDNNSNYNSNNINKNKSNKDQVLYNKKYLRNERRDERLYTRKHCCTDYLKNIW